MTTIVPPVVDDPDLALRIRTNPERLLARCAAEHGEVFTVAVDGGHRITYVLDPHAFHPLLTARQVDFSPVSRQSKLRFGLGDIVATDQRVRALSHALTGGLRGSGLRTTLEAFDGELDRAVAGYAASLDGTERRTVQDLVRQTLIPATVRALFGHGVVDGDFTADFASYASAISARFAGSDPALHPAGAAAEQALMDRLADCLGRTDTAVLATLSKRLPDDAAVTDEQRLRTLLMLLWGSLVNLVPTSVWMYASILAALGLVEELRHSRGTADGRRLRRSVVTETLRLYSRPNIYRAVTADVDLELSDGRTIRLSGGDWVALFPRFLHHDPDVFHAPQRFDPRRFCPPADHPDAQPTFSKRGTPLRHPTVVFGLGRGRCPGDAYSLAVLDRVAATWTWAFDSRLVAVLPEPITDTVSSTPRPAEPVEVVVRGCGTGQ